MLKTRLLTASCLIPIVLLILFLAPQWVFLGLLYGLILLASLEFSQMCQWQTHFQQLGFVLITGLLVLFGSRVIFFENLLFLVVCFWCASFLLLYFYPKPEKMWCSKLFRSVMSIWVLWGFWIALTHLFVEPQGNKKVLLLFCLVWATDTLAYFFGKFFGKRPLALKISPNKTYVGVLGGFLGAALVGTVASFIFSGKWMWILWLSLLTAFFAILGDLLQSALKREAGLKDSGCILPGHGGLLDRIDSLLSATPVFTFLLIA